MTPIRRWVVVFVLLSASVGVLVAIHEDPADVAREETSAGDLRLCLERFNANHVAPEAVVREAQVTRTDSGCRIAFGRSPRAPGVVFLLPTGGGAGSVDRNAVPSPDLLPNAAVDRDGRLFASR